MIHDLGLPMFLWEEESGTIVYVQNKCPHKILKNMTPEEAFTGVKAEVGHLPIFGCSVYIHVPKEKRMKLEPSGIRGLPWDTMSLQRPTKFTSRTEANRSQQGCVI